MREKGRGFECLVEVNVWKKWEDLELKEKIKKILKSWE